MQKKADTASTSRSLLNLDRLKALTDGIFAIVLTLMVLDLKLPETLDIGNASQLFEKITELGNSFLNYFVSFVILASIWIGNVQRYHKMKATDVKHLWITLFELLFVSLLPFSTSLMSNYGGLVLAEEIFHSNIFLIQLFSYFQWKHAYADSVLATENELNLNQSIKGKYLFFLIPPVLGMTIAAFLPYWSTMVYLLIPLKAVFDKNKE